MAFYVERTDDDKQASVDVRAAAQRSAALPSFASAQQIQFHIDTDLTQPIIVGKGTILHLKGWCYHPEQRIRHLALLVDTQQYAITNASLVTQDVLQAHAGVGDRHGFSLTSGFIVLVPFAAIETPRHVDLVLRATLSNGQREEIAIGIVQLLPAACSAPIVPQVAKTAVETTAPLIAICMATFKPPIALFRKQIASIISQTHDNWICIINDDNSPSDSLIAIKEIIGDDPRFFVYQNATRRGFYGNFEACLAHVPPEAQFVALADQDDEWYPEKLAACVAAFTPQTTLVYTDMNIVAADGEVKHTTFWTGRKNNYRDFKSLIFANTVTGAASVFRAALLADILPFPPRIGEAYHDHWIACVAKAEGALGYIDRPLYAYQQHTDNVIGHVTENPYGHWAKPRNIVRLLLSPSALKEKMRIILWERQGAYYNNVLRVVIIAQTILLRIPGLPARKRMILRRFSRYDHALGGLLQESVLSRIQRRPTLGAEWYLARGWIASRILNGYYRLRAHSIYTDTLSIQANEAALRGEGDST